MYDYDPRLHKHVFPEPEKFSVSVPSQSHENNCRIACFSYPLHSFSNSKFQVSPVWFHCCHHLDALRIARMESVLLQPIWQTSEPRNMPRAGRSRHFLPIMYLPLVMEPPFQNMVPTAYFIAKRNKLYVSRNKFIDYLFNTFPVHALTKKAVAGKGASLAQWERCTDGLLRLSGRACMGTVFRSGSFEFGTSIVRILQF